MRDFEGGFIFFLRRFFLSLLAILGIITFSFFLIHLVPGDPVDLILGDQASAVDQRELKKQMGLDQPISKQYLYWIQGVLKFDFGKSIYDQKNVSFHLKKALPPTLLLSLVALFLAALWGIPAALLSVYYKNPIFNNCLTVVTLSSFCLPVFFTAPLLIWLLALYFPLLPVSGWESPAHFVLPSISLAFPLGSALCQMGQASLRDIMNQDFIRTARSKGLSSFYIYFKHALKAAASPIITIFSLQSAALMTGTIIVETIFDWPGLGLLLFQSIIRRDYPVIQASVLVIAIIYLVVNVVADLCYGLVHPQTRRPT